MSPSFLIDSQIKNSRDGNYRNDQNIEIYVSFFIF